MERLDRTATRALRALLDQQPTTSAKVAFAWRIAAGPSLARAVSIAWSEDGTLSVDARSDEWQRELQRARPVIAARLANLLGDGVVRTITITAAPVPTRANDRRHFR